MERSYAAPVPVKLHETTTIRIQCNTKFQYKPFPCLFPYNKKKKKAMDQFLFHNSKFFHKAAW